MKTTNSAKYRLNFFKNEVEAFQFTRTLSYPIYNAASPGEVITTANLLKERETLYKTGLIYEMNFAIANENLAVILRIAGKNVSARDHYLKTLMTTTSNGISIIFETY